MSERYPRQRRNLLAFGGDYIAFAVAMGLLSVNIVLPDFAERLGASEVLVGVLVTAMQISWGPPQIFVGNLVARHPLKRPLLVRAIFIGRPLTVLVPLVIALTGGEPPWLSLAVVLVVYSTFFFSDAFASVPWMNLLSRVFPPERRGQIVSRWQLGKAVGLLAVSGVVSLVLGERGPAFPYNYAVLFAGVTLVLVLGAVSLSRLYEPPPREEDEPETPVPWRELGQHLRRLWGEDLRFRRLTVARVLFSLSGLAFPFYVVYATRELAFPPATLGLFILAQTIGASVASLLLGRVADRSGPQRAIQSGALVAMTAPVVALVFALQLDAVTGPLRYVYAWIYICMGLADNLVMLGFMNYLFDVSLPRQRSLTMGAFNAFAAVGVLGPVIGGWLLGRTSFVVLFATALTFAVGAMVLAFALPPVRQRAAAAA